MKIRGFVNYWLLNPEGEEVLADLQENLLLRNGHFRAGAEVIGGGFLTEPAYMLFGESSASVDYNQVGLQGSDLTANALTGKSRTNNGIRLTGDLTNTRTVTRQIGEVGIAQTAVNEELYARVLVGGGSPLDVPSSYRLEVAWTLVFGDPF